MEDEGGSIVANLSLSYIWNGFVCRGTIFQSKDRVYSTEIKLGGYNRKILDEEEEENRREDQKNITDKQLKSVEDLSKSSKRLVLATWFLVLVTLLLVLITFFTNKKRIK